MSKVLILGATGTLGRSLTRQAIAAHHEVTVVVRTPSRLLPSTREQVTVHQADLASVPRSALATMLRDQDVVINTAGRVTDGQGFVDLFGRVVTGRESLPQADRPVCWFLAGAALLDLDDRGRRGIDLPRVAATYWPHRANFNRLHRSALDWRLLCPGPLVPQQALGLARMRITLDRVPVELPSFTRSLPGALVLPFFIRRVPEMIVSYADAAALILANLTPSGGMSHRRVGLALPLGMRGEKPQWAGAPGAAREGRLGARMQRVPVP